MERKNNNTKEIIEEIERKNNILKVKKERKIERKKERKKEGSQNKV